MERTDRFYRIDQMLRERRATPISVLIEALGVSRATVKRDLEYLRDRLHAPIVWDPNTRGYRYDEPMPGSLRYALPGLWFNASEVHALLTMEHLLSHLQPGLLGPHIEPLRARIRMLLDSGDHSAAEVVRRIHVLQLASRTVELGQFEAIATGVLGRRRLRLEHYNRRLDETILREVSPQRLVYYRDNWYLDAWCHLRKGLRSFSVDAIRAVEPLSARARNVADRTLDAELGSGYGIFTGQRTRKAVLRFSAKRARWVAREAWHTSQEGHFDDEGRYVLTLPYSKDTELIMDVLRYGADVEVLRPAALREKVRIRLRLAQAVYGD
ncbi:MAG: WYL domain-containing protein [Pseudomonadota bacterium]|nr:WYL domain-containing protein [Pseudomonadota bacterium]